MEVWYLILGFFLYGFLGWCAEVAFAAVRYKKFVNRGFLNGPICPIYGVGVMLVVELLDPYRDNLVLLYILSAVLVTVLEWVTGFLLEKIFHHKWWDYSNMPLNLNGYVCLLFSLIWGVACVVIVYFIHPLTAGLLSLIPELIAAVISIVLCIGLAADLVVTVISVCKLNSRLKNMEEIAGELRKLSVQVGTGIYQNVMEGMERQEQRKQKAEELKKRYQELLERNGRADRRILKAFPGLTPQRHKDAFADLKEQMKAQIEKGRKKAEEAWKEKKR